MTRADHILEKIAKLNLYKAEHGSAYPVFNTKHAVTGTKSSQAPYSYFEGDEDFGLEPGMVGWGGRKQDPRSYHSPADKKKTKVVKKGKIYTTKTAGAAGTIARIAKRIGPHLALPGGAILGALGYSKFKDKEKKGLDEAQKKQLRDRIDKINEGRYGTKKEASAVNPLMSKKDPLDKFRSKLDKPKGGYRTPHAGGVTLNPRTAGEKGPDLPNS